MKKIVLLTLTSVVGANLYAGSILPTSGVLKSEAEVEALASSRVVEGQLPSVSQKPLAKVGSFTPDDIIYERPAGIESRYVRSGRAYTQSFLGYGTTTVSDMLGHMVEGEDGFVYMFEPMTQIATKSWIKGEVEGDKLTFKLPQALYSAENENGVMEVYTLQMAHYESSSAEEEGIYYVNRSGQTQDLTFHKIDGVWVMDEETYNDRPVIAGMFNENDEWVVYSDWDMSFEPFTLTSLTPPASLTTEEWTMTYGGIDGRMVNIGFDGNDIWLLGLAGDAWVKGTVEGNVIKFPSEQFLGVNSQERLLYFYAANEEKRIDEYYGFEYTALVPVDYATFDYDKEQNIMRCQNSIVINTGTTSLNFYNALYSLPVIRIPSDNPSLVPANPIIELYNEFNPDWGMGSLYFLISKLNADNEFIDTNNLYYRVYVDDDLFYFEPDEYADVEEPMCDVPFYFTNGSSISYYGANSHFFNFYFEGADRIGIQVIYKDGNDEYLSDIVYTDGETVNVEGIESENSVPVRTEYYDLYGRRINQPEKGVYIRSVILSNGKRISTKTVNS